MLSTTSLDCLHQIKTKHNHQFLPGFDFMATNVAFEKSSSTVIANIEASPETSTRQSTPWYKFKNVYDALSPSRQIFCLFCLFDFLFTFFLWIIYAQGASVTGLDDSLSEEVKHYGITSSLFDVMLLSLVRACVLLVVYGYYVSDKVYIVAITTFVSTVYLIVKAFVFEFENSSKNDGNRPVDYFLHIGSFILCWAETWYLKIKVLPREKKAGLSQSSRAPNYGTIRAASSAYSVLSFHTPPEQDSEEEEQVVKANLHYIETARKFTSKALNFLYAEKQWDVEKKKDDILIESTYDENLGKVLKVRTFINANPRVVHPLVYGDIEHMLQWNNQLTQIEIVYKVNSTVDITYSVTGEAAGGLMSARDFVNVRHYQRIGSMFLSTSSGITTPLKPPVEGIVRGEVPLNCYALSPTEDEPDKSEFAWITTTTLKPSSIPQVIVDRTMPGFLIETVANLKKYCEAFTNNHAPTQ